MKKYFTIPNFFTMMSIFCGWMGIVILLRESFFLSFGVILLGFIFDVLDGVLARRLKQESIFGKNLDSFSDVILHLLYPAMAWYLYFGFNGNLSVVIIFLSLFCGIFRLARFNTEGFRSDKEKSYYIGVPVVFSHLLTLIFIILDRFSILNNWFGNMSVLLLSFLMISTILFPKPKSFFSVGILLIVIISSFSWVFWLEFGS